MATKKSLLNCFAVNYEIATLCGAKFSFLKLPYLLKIIAMIFLILTEVAPNGWENEKRKERNKLAIKTSVEVEQRRKKN